MEMESYCSANGISFHERQILYSRLKFVQKEEEDSLSHNSNSESPASLVISTTSPCGQGQLSAGYSSCGSTSQISPCPTGNYRIHQPITSSPNNISHNTRPDSTSNPSKEFLSNNQLSPIEANSNMGYSNHFSIIQSDPQTNDSNLQSQPPPKKLYTDDIPVLDSFEGPYGFDLLRPASEELTEAQDIKPNTSCYYFRDEQGWTNLFSKKAPNWWNLSYKCRIQPPDGCFLRLVPVYGASDKQQEVIQRCFEDFNTFQCVGLARYSVIRLGHSHSEYFYDPSTERLCVTIPFEKPKEGCEYSQFSGKFMCFNSCFNGGQGSKKPLYLVITLERNQTGSQFTSDQCEVLGRQCIKFRSCACPKRDKENIGRRAQSDSNSVPNSEKSSPFLDLSSGSSTPQAKRKRRTPSTRVSENDHFIERSHVENWSFSENQSSAINCVQISGEDYTLLAIPNRIPGAVSSIQQIRLSLLSTYFFAQQHVTGTIESITNQEQSEIGTINLVKNLVANLNKAEILASTLYQKHCTRTDRRNVESISLRPQFVPNHDKFYFPEEQVNHQNGFVTNPSHNYNDGCLQYFSENPSFPLGQDSGFGSTLLVNQNSSLQFSQGDLLLNDSHLKPEYQQNFQSPINMKISTNNYDQIDGLAANETLKNDD